MEFARRRWLHHDDRARIEAEREPALHQGSAHLAGAEQHDGPGEIAIWVRGHSRHNL
jgi:hypothetical protein